MFFGDRVHRPQRAGAFTGDEGSPSATHPSLAAVRPSSKWPRRATSFPWQIERFGDELFEVVRTFEADLNAGRVDLGRRRGRS